MSYFDKFPERVGEWKERAINIQSAFNTVLVGRPLEAYSSSHAGQLKMKIGYSLFNATGKMKNTSDDILDYVYNDEQTKIISDIYKQIWKLQERNEVQVGFIFLVILNESLVTFIEAVCRVRKDSKDFFIDRTARVYSSWADFKNSNKLPKCLFCFPLNGIYEKGVAFDFDVSPEYRRSASKVWKAMDYTTIGGAALSTSIGLLSLAVPVTTPFLAASVASGAASGVLGITKSSATLIDRSQHKESIGLRSQESRSAWLNIASSVACVGSLGATAIAAKMGTASRLAKPVAIGVGASSAAVATATIIDSSINIANADQLYTRDVMNLALGVFFFTGSIISIKTAASIQRKAASTSTGTDVSSLRSALQTAEKSIDVEMLGALIGLTAVIATPEETFLTETEILNQHHNSTDVFRETKETFFKKFEILVNPIDRKTIFGHFPMHQVFDHLNENETETILTNIKTLIESDQMDFILKVFLSCLRDKMNSVHADKSINAFFCDLLNYLISNASLSVNEIWAKALEFLEDKEAKENEKESIDDLLDEFDESSWLMV